MPRVRVPPSLLLDSHHLWSERRLTFSSSEDVCGMEAVSRLEDLRHLWIPLTLKMAINKSQGLQISSWPEGEEVSQKGDKTLFRPLTAFALPLAEWRRGGGRRGPLRLGGDRASCP